MAREVTVTRAQRNAARAILERSAKSGRPVSPVVKKIAEAKPQRDADTSESTPTRS
jgi:hypothetical protein